MMRIKSIIVILLVTVLSINAADKNLKGFIFGVDLVPTSNVYKNSENDDITGGFDGVTKVEFRIKDQMILGIGLNNNIGLYAGCKISCRPYQSFSFRINPIVGLLLKKDKCLFDLDGCFSKSVININASGGYLFKNRIRLGAEVGFRRERSFIETSHWSESLLEDTIMFPIGIKVGIILF